MTSESVAAAFYRDMTGREATEDYRAGQEYAQDCGVEQGTQEWFECFMVGVMVAQLQRERTEDA